MQKLAKTKLEKDIEFQFS